MQFPPGFFFRDLLFIENKEAFFILLSIKTNLLRRMMKKLGLCYQAKLSRAFQEDYNFERFAKWWLLSTLVHSEDKRWRLILFLRFSDDLYSVEGIEILGPAHMKSRAWNLAAVCHLFHKEAPDPGKKKYEKEQDKEILEKDRLDRSFEGDSILLQKLWYLWINPNGL